MILLPGVITQNAEPGVTETSPASGTEQRQSLRSYWHLSERHWLQGDDELD